MQSNLDYNNHVRAAYNSWADDYDSSVNNTRDLDEEVIDHYSEIFENKNVLELGCGTGKNTLMLADSALSVSAVDFSPEMLNTARQKLSNFTNVVFYESDISKDDLSIARKHSVGTINLVLEHVENLDNVFRLCAVNISDGGKLLISELHPFRQYLGVRARFERDGKIHKVQSFVHNISDFLVSAKKFDFNLIELKEWFHSADSGKPPRILSLLFEKI